ncbi:hypothetical protein [Candidatus Nitrosacidococcus tergens]|uniref:p-aminobenzoate N-oxygenase AurF n=1 Tax=Candidatus Nitrosacidococcus tergens TaxID=553981 RepID=A0A7G1Q8L4_9GAMM|nr:hypothetical protein [Candidatus Nitrosacidococcus tergens]CAB1275277.1 conserved protein of unknown function [Candidatus Nitrosacidococcus tergens]
MSERGKYRSIFSPTSPEEMEKNFESYWEYTQEHTGGLLEEEKDLVKKKERLQYFKDHPVRAKNPIDKEAFYRNYMEFKDDPSKVDRKTLWLTNVYKFARHEWAGISAAWDAEPVMADSKKLTQKISRLHMAEEFCHARLFYEMLQVFNLDKAEWALFSPLTQKTYYYFVHLPGLIKDIPAFNMELMGLTFYKHLDVLIDDVFADEPEAAQRLRELLYEITIDELAHLGQRRNFLSPMQVKIAKATTPAWYRYFFRSCVPEGKYLFNVDKMIQDGLDFDYSLMDDKLIDQSWVPTYCQA